MKRLLMLLLFFAISLPDVLVAEEHLRLATTTSTANTGLLAELHPPFESEYNAKVDVIAVGTGAALRLGQNGDVDIVMVHAPAAEKKFVEEGYGVERLAVMHNDFVILGPVEDPAGVRQATDLKDALKYIATGEYSFVSRGDDSGTHKKEKSLWQSIELIPSGNWYMAAGQGMGAILQIANEKLAYTLSDRGTYLAYKDKIDLGIVFEGAQELFNPYHIILVNPQKHPHVKHELAQKYAYFIRSEQGQKIIRDFKIRGEQLFIPDVIE